MSKLVRFSISVPAELAAAFDRRAEQRGYANRSEAVRDLMREDLVAAEWEDDASEVVGTATIIYQHHATDIQKALTRMQHQYCHVIICATHVHLDEENCMEVVILRGKSAEVRALAGALIAARGVKHGRLVSTSTGRALP